MTHKCASCADRHIREVHGLPRRVALARANARLHEAQEQRCQVAQLRVHHRLRQHTHSVQAARGHTMRGDLGQRGSFTRKSQPAPPRAGGSRAQAAASRARAARPSQCPPRAAPQVAVDTCTGANEDQECYTHTHADAYARPLDAHTGLHAVAITDYYGAQIMFVRD